MSPGPGECPPIRDRLFAEFALVLEVDAARDVAGVLERYWLKRARLEGAVSRRLTAIAGLDLADVERLEDEVERWLDVARDGPDALELREAPQDRYWGFEPIGMGGMGVVFLARDGELDREVAFKVVHPGTGENTPASPFALGVRSTREGARGDRRRRTERFLQEARVTSGLEHPGIPPVYELGRTPEGLPYYTMRYVRGERTLVDAIADAEAMETRLTLVEPFLMVCDTVRYAHSRGVLHRDIKPANVALGEFGEVLLLDWGLARVRGDPDAGSADSAPVGPSKVSGRLTTAARAIGTPGYMSPEAARGDPELDERCDVYGLGATLYEILTGVRPLDAVFGPALVSRLESEDPVPALEREPAVPRELSAICARALSRRPEDRFRDVREMSDAIRAWKRRSEVDHEVDRLLVEAYEERNALPTLDGDRLFSGIESVTALAMRILELRPGQERATELLHECQEVRRRAIEAGQRRARGRLLLRVGVTGLILAVGTAMAVAWVLNAKRREAEVARDRADRLIAFILFDLHQSLESRGYLALLEAASRMAIEYYDSVRPEALGEDGLRRRSVALRNAGSVLRAQGDLLGARRVFGEVRDIRRHLLEREPDSGRRQDDLAEVWSLLAEVEASLGNSERALELYRRARAIHQMRVEKEGAPEHRERLARVLVESARLHAALGNEKDCANRCDHALDLWRGVLEDEPDWKSARAGLADGLVALGDVMARRGEMDRAIEEYEAALGMHRDLVTEDPAEIGPRVGLSEALGRVGGQLLARGRPPEALPHFRERLRLCRELAERDATHAEGAFRLARALGGMAYAQYRSGDHDGARERYAESLKILDRLCAGPSVSIPWLRLRANHLAMVAHFERDAKNLDVALERYRESRGLQERLVSLEPDRIDLRLGLARLWLDIGDLHIQRRDPEATLTSFEKAKGHLDDVLRAGESGFAARLFHADCLCRLADARRKLDEASPAADLYEEALATLERLRERSPESTRVLDALADVLSSRGTSLSKSRRWEEASPDLSVAVRLRERLVALEPRVAIRHRHLAYALLLKANNFARADRREEALAAHRAAVESDERACELRPEFRPGHAQYAEEYRRYALYTGALRPESPADHLTVAWDHYFEKRYAEAVASFRRAFVDSSIPENLDSPALYYAVRSAALASESSPDRREEFLDQAVAWLTEDVRLRLALIERLERESGEHEDDPEKARKLRGLAEEQREHLQFAREDDELEAIRDTPAFRGLLREGAYPLTGSKGR